MKLFQFVPVTSVHLPLLTIVNGVSIPVNEEDHVRETAQPKA